MNHQPQTKPAFTLIELLVVIGIVAVISSAVIMSTGSAREKGKDSRRKQDLQALSTALVAFYADHHQYPPHNSGTDLDYASETNPATWIPELAPYLSKFPNDPLITGIFRQIANLALNTISQSKNYTASIFTKTNSPPAQPTTPQVAGVTTTKWGAGIWETTLTPTGTGDAQNWTPSAGLAQNAWQLVDEEPSDTDYPTIDASYIESSTANQEEYFTKPALPVAPDADVTGVEICIRAKATPANTVNDIAPGLKLLGQPQAVFTKLLGGNSDYFLTENFAAATCTAIGGFFPLNAGTINDAQIAIKKIGSDTVTVSQIYIKIRYVATTGSVTGPVAGCVEIGATQYTFTANYDYYDHDYADGHITTAKILINNTPTYNPPSSSPAGAFEAVFDHDADTTSVKDADDVWRNIPPGESYSNGYATLERVTSHTHNGKNLAVDWKITFDNWADESAQVWLGVVSTSGPEEDDGNGGFFTPTKTLPYAPMMALQIPCAVPPPETCPPNCPQVPPTPGRGACDSKSNIYCYRVSETKRVFVLWAQLENTNDPELSNKPGTLCNQDSTDFTTGTYAGLGKPTGSDALNYCVKSPPL